ncbi:MAG TPA: DUF1461 domain-containing protein [Gammaproteobacteria bacterium]|nr:DUF1461 domain-containing protein [Gammaproteobacteria bacterium]
MPFRATFLRFLAHTTTVTAALLVSLALAWYTLSAVNFFYPVLHDVIGIDATIAEYAPGNIYRKSFDQTTRKQRAELFRQIVYGINHDGRGLESIRYTDAQGRPIDRLLREAEIIHLRDVAQLLNTLKAVAWVSGALLFAMVGFCRLRNTGFPAPARVLGTAVLALLLIAVIVSVSGAEKLFYRWHTLVFPEGHQWFFYYEESLMTMLMKAPDLFAWLAALLALFTLAYFYLVLRLASAFLRKDAVATDTPQERSP